MSTELDLVAIFGPTTDRTLDGAAHRPGQSAEMVLSSGARYPFDQPVVIGRVGDQPDEPLVEPSHRTTIQRVDIESPMLSRRHACVSPVGRRASVLDLGSTNGTLVITPDRGPIACIPGRIVLFEVGWRVELGGVVWLRIEPHANGDRSRPPTELQAGDTQ